MSASPRKFDRPLAVIALVVCSVTWADDGYAGKNGVTPPPDELSMIIASSTGDLPALKHLMDMGMAPDHHDFTGNTPLIYAARYARLDVVQFLLRHGVDVNAATQWGTTALKESVRKGSLPVVQVLLEAGASVDQLDNRHESALFDAVRYRRLWAVEMLLARRANVHIRNHQGYSPLHYAIEQDQPQIWAVLQQRADVAGRALDEIPSFHAMVAPGMHVASGLYLQDANADKK